MKRKFKALAIICFFSAGFQSAKSQTDMDAIMMNKNNFCGGVMYGYSSWKNYWEGTFKRDNANLGNVSTQTISIMGNYGITNKLNVLFGLPYIQTKASAGQLKGQNGIQDLSLAIKFLPIEKEIGNGTFSFYTIGLVSLPLSNYVADFLPLSIGLHSKTASLRLLADYQYNNLFVTAAGTYTVRDKVKIDRNAYYTNELHYSNQVSMPDATNINVRLGYRSDRLIAEAVFDKFITQGGFDIRKNDMPFLSNKMNATRVGVGGKYNFKKIAGLSAVANGNYIIGGRNVGQAYSISAGAFYIMDWSRKKKKEAKK